MDDIIFQVQAMYDQAGEYFSKTRSKGYGGKGYNWPVIQKFVSKIKADEKVLDVGCGNGRLVSGLPKGVQYKGIDFSKTLIKHAQESYPKREFRYGNLVDEHTWENLDTYDRIFCVAVLHHLPEEQQQKFVLENMRKVARKGASLYLTVWNLWQPKFLQYHLASAELKKMDEKFLKVPFNKEWERFCVAMDETYLEKLLEDSGWKIEELGYFDRAGKKTEMAQGENLVAVAKNV